MTAGYRRGGPSDHEEKSALIATKLPQMPKTALESILCDADMFHLGSDDFIDKSKQLHKEMNALSSSKTSKKQWRKKPLNFLGSMNFTPISLLN